MTISDKIKHFESLNRGQIISHIIIYIDDRIKYSNIYSDIDVLQYTTEAIKKLLDGTHAWNIVNDPNPTRLLQNNVWRAICHEMEKRKNSKEYKNFHNPIDYDSLLDSAFICDEEFGEEDNIEIYEDEIWKWLKNEAEKKNEDAWYFLDAEEELYKNYKKIPKRADIAKHLGWELEKVTNVKRWIKRNFEEKINKKRKGAS